MIIDKLLIKKDKCIILVNEVEYTISYEIALRYKLKQGLDFDKDTFYEMLDESEAILCKEYLYNMIAKYLKTEKGYTDKLYQLGYHKKAVDNAIENALNYGYINDDTFCDSYISTYKNKKGTRKLRQELQVKGIKNEILDKHLSDFESQPEVILAISQKFVKNKEHNLDTKQKLYRHLISKGFDYEEVSKFVNDWYKNVE